MYEFITANTMEEIQAKTFAEAVGISKIKLRHMNLFDGRVIEVIDGQIVTREELRR